MGVPLRNSPPRRSGRNRSNRSSSNNKSTTSSANITKASGRKESLQLTLIGMAICAVIMFSKTSTINKKYKRLNDFYFYASDNTSITATATRSSSRSIGNDTTTTNTASTDGNNSNNNVQNEREQNEHTQNEYEIKLNELELWRQIRNEKVSIYNEWFLNKKGDDKLCPNADSLHHNNNNTTEQGISLLPPLPPKNGPILDFVVGKLK